MGRLSLSFLLIMLTFTSFAQSPDRVLARVRYTYLNENDTLKNGKTRNENMLLFVGKNASLYTSYDKLNFEIADELKFRNSIKTRAIGGGQPVAYISDNTPTQLMSKTSYFYFVKENKLITKENIVMSYFLFEEEVPSIKWKITTDTMNFSGLNCLKALANFEGKNWVAWFAPSLPFYCGPWKLNKLPGLIIDAYEENKAIHFQFAGFENAKEGDHLRIDDVTKRPNARPGDYNPLDQLIGRDVGSAYFENIIKLPPEAIKTNKKDIEKLKAAYKKDPKGFTRSLSKF
ncbi:MAG: GLPGLI family protein [Bacteroidota bacterium]